MRKDLNREDISKDCLHRDESATIVCLQRYENDAVDSTLWNGFDDEISIVK